MGRFNGISAPNNSTEPWRSVIVVEDEDDDVAADVEEDEATDEGISIRNSLSGVRVYRVTLSGGSERFALLLLAVVLLLDILVILYYFPKSYFPPLSISLYSLYSLSLTHSLRASLLLVATYDALPLFNTTQPILHLSLGLALCSLHTRYEEKGQK